MSHTPEVKKQREKMKNSCQRSLKARIRKLKPSKSERDEPGVMKLPNYLWGI